ncbi:MAG: AMP-binding protein [Gammaproteobacteria bacterium]|nr:MAG: AMP-binding protein [Gammaproteobacteria bacterium]
MKPDYQSFFQSFDIDAFQKDILAGDYKSGINAYIECCGKHAKGEKADKIALVHEDTKGNTRKLTYAELDAESAKVANLLTELGVNAGERVSTMLPRTPELLAVILGAWRIGAVYQPLFTAFGVEAIEFRLNKADTKVVFTNHENREKFNEIKQMPKMVMVGSQSDADAHGDLLYSSLLSKQSTACDAVLLKGEAPFLQMFTSGTVGKPKGVSVPMNAFTAFYLYMDYAVGLTEDDNFWNMADPGWAYGLYYAITGPLLMGATTHFNEHNFSAEQTYDFIKAHNITNLASAPTAYRMMKSSGVFDNKANEFTTLKRASSAGEPLNTEVVTWVSDNLGCEVMDHYGQTEMGMACCCHHRLAHPTPTGSMGLPLPGYTLAVLDDELNEVATGTTGQLAVVISQSPAMYFTGYSWNEKSPFEGDYYLTGDIVEQHDDGTYWFSGRDDDIITTAGYRVGPTDVENVILEHEAIAESAVVGIPDEIRGSIIKAFVVLKDGYQGSEALQSEIKSLVHDRLSAHAFPRAIEFVDSLPKTPSGKIQRFILRNQS